MAGVRLASLAGRLQQRHCRGHQGGKERLVLGFQAGEGPGQVGQSLHAHGGSNLCTAQHGVMKCSAAQQSEVQQAIKGGI